MDLPSNADRKLSTLPLHESDVLFRLLVESAKDFAIFTTDLEGRIISWNSGAEALFGYAEDEIVAHSADAIFTPEDRAALVPELERETALREGHALDECWHLRKDGTRFYASGMLSPLLGVNLPGFVKILRDLTQSKQAEEELRQSEEHFRALVNQNLAGIAKIDLTGKILFVNGRFCELLGYTCDEMLELRIEDFVHPDDMPESLEKLEQLKTGNRPFEIEKRYVRKDGSIIWAHNGVSPITGADGAVEFAVVVSIDITAHRDAEDSLQESRDELEERVKTRTADLNRANLDLHAEAEERQRVEHLRSDLLRRLISAQEDERRKIARNMHDQFGNQLTALNLKLSFIKEQVELLETIGRQLDADVDEMVWELRPAKLDSFGLPAALESQAGNWSKHLGIRVELHTSGFGRERIDPDAEITLYRITQEALNNIAKHAGASNVDIILERRASYVSLIIDDNGRGFNLKHIAADKGRGLGLIGMNERAALVGGTTQIESEPGNGTTVIVRIPISSQNF